MKSFLITSVGYKKMMDDLHCMKYIRRPEITKTIKVARELGDLSENAEYHAAREEQALLESKIRDIESKKDRVELVDPKSVKSDAIQFGATVSLEDIESGETSKYIIVSEYESNPNKMLISIGSPVAYSLLGYKKKDIVEVKTPKGVRTYIITDVKYKDIEL